jgi:predicted Rossmann fold nucleotide-binding protein DprA/Smf involved in DNA uptake
LALSAQDVLEALGYRSLRLEATAPGSTGDPVCDALLNALDEGCFEFDEMVAASGIPAPAALAALALLELRGVVESRGASRYARVETRRRGEDCDR